MLCGKWTVYKMPLAWHLSDPEGILMSGCVMLGKASFKHWQNHGASSSPFSNQGPVGLKPNPACLPPVSRDVPPARCEGCLIPVNSDSALANFQVCFRTFCAFLSPTHQGQQTRTRCAACPGSVLVSRAVCSSLCSPEEKGSARR